MQQETKKVEEPAQAFTPIVVTEKKIISLKKIKDDLSAPEISLKPKKSKQEVAEVAEESTSNNLSQNRRIILKSDSGDLQKVESKNRIFDRLEKKISVNESIKRNIQKMVKDNVE